MRPSFTGCRGGRNLLSQTQRDKDIKKSGVLYGYLERAGVLYGKHIYNVRNKCSTLISVFVAVSVRVNDD